MADHPLEILDNKIETVPASWVVASHLLTPGELKNNIPIVYPKQNLYRRATTPVRRPLPDPARKKGRLARARRDGLAAARERDLREGLG